MSSYNCFDCKHSRLDTKGFYCDLSYPDTTDEEANRLFLEYRLRSTMVNGVIYFNENGDSLPDGVHQPDPCSLLDPNGQGYFKDKES